MTEELSECRRSAQILHDVATLIEDLTTLKILANDIHHNVRYEGMNSSLIVEIYYGGIVRGPDRIRFGTKFSCITRAFYDKFKADGILVIEADIGRVAFEIGPRRENS